MVFDSEKLTNSSAKALNQAIAIARQNGNIQVTSFHLASVLFSDEDTGVFGRRICEKNDIPNKLVQSKLDQKVSALPQQHPAPNNITPDRKLHTVLDKAEKYRGDNKDTHVALDHLLLGLLDNNDVVSVLADAGLTKHHVLNALKEVRGSQKVTSASAEQQYDALSRYGMDLVKIAEDEKLDPVIGRDSEIRRVIQVLSRRTKNNPVLIGEPGVGKTAIVEGLAQRIVRGDVPKNLLNRHVFSLDLGALVAGASHRGEFEERLKAVLKEVKDSNGAIVLFIDEIHTVLGAGAAQGSMDAANLLKPMLARGELRCIGATTLDEYRKYVEKDPAFERRFQQVQVNEPSTADTVSILRGLKEKYESHHGVTIQDAALVIAANLSSRYISGRFLPDKAIDLVDEACSSTRVQLDSRPEVLDTLERRKLQLDVEATALAQEKDEPSKARLKQVRSELAKVEEELRPLRMQLEAEQARVQELSAYRRRREECVAKMNRAERMGDLALAADLKFGAIPDLDVKIAQEQQKFDEYKNQSSNLLSDVVTPDKIAEIVGRWTGIPVSKLSQSESERLLHLADHLHQRVIGQNEAVDAVAEAVLRSRAGLSRENQPLGSFLFLGPTGVGKTELAKALAAELFDDERNIVRLDMSEYMEQHSVARLIGSPPGYVGYEEGGQLTEAVRRKPFAVVLFDEVEKAHQRVWNVLLQVLDDGRLTDGKGRVVDFTNTIIILTSNLGAEHLLAYSEAIGKLQHATSGEPISLKGATSVVEEKARMLKAQADEKVMQSVREHFRPEFLNRLDNVVIFTPLDMNQMKQIVYLQMDHLLKRLQDKEISISLTDEAALFILRESYTPQYGARPLRRYLEKHLTTEISRLLIAGKLPRRSQVSVTVVDEVLEFEISHQPLVEEPDADDTPMEDVDPSFTGRKRRRG